MFKLTGTDVLKIASEIGHEETQLLINLLNYYLKTGNGFDAYGHGDWMEFYDWGHKKTRFLDYKEIPYDLLDKLEEYLLIAKAKVDNLPFVLIRIDYSIIKDILEDNFD